LDLRRGVAVAATSTDTTLPGSVPPKASRRKLAAGALIVIVVVVGALTGYVLEVRGSSSPDLLTNGGFETGLQGWAYDRPPLPTIESSVVHGGSYAALFQTPTNDPQTTSPCLLHGEGCAQMNTSTIFQEVSNVTVSGGTRFSMAVDPMFQYPSGLQVSLEFGLSSTAKARTNSTAVILFYEIDASSQQCANYSQAIVNSSARATRVAVHCLAAPQGSWTMLSRHVSSDLPSGVDASELDNSLLIMSVSFAGAGPNDLVYVDSIHFG